MKVMLFLFKVLLLIYVLALPASALAIPAISFDENTGGSGNNNNQSVGWQFNVISPVTLVGLGWFDQGGDGLGHEHIVGVWNQGGTLLTSVLVPSGTTAPLDGQYRTEAISPITLPASTGYIVGGENFSTSGDRLAFNVSQVVNSSLSYVDATFSDLDSGFVRPTDFSIAETGFYGPMFSLQTTAPIPEPATMLLLGSGLIGLAGYWRKKFFRK